MSTANDYERLLKLQAKAIDILEEVMDGFGDSDENRMKLEAVKVFNVMAKQSGIVAEQDTEDSLKVLSEGIKRREAAIATAEQAARDRVARDKDADMVLRLISGGA